MPVTGLSTFLTDIGTIMTSFWDWIGKVFTVYTSNPVLMVVFTIFIVGATIGLFTRLLGAR